MAGRGRRTWRGRWRLGSSSGVADYHPIYKLELPLAEKIRTVAREIYRAADIALPDAVAKRLASFEAAGFGEVPVCIAKTQYSFTADPAVLGAPEGHVLPVRDVRLSAGAGFVVAICGDIRTMPGLPAVARRGVDLSGAGWGDRGAVLKPARGATYLRSYRAVLEGEPRHHPYDVGRHKLGLSATGATRDLPPHPLQTAMAGER